MPRRATATGHRHPVQVERTDFHDQEGYWRTYWDDDVFYGHVLGCKGLERRAVVLCLNESGDFRLARAEGAIGDDHLLGDMGDVFLGKVLGRVSRDDITVYESLGIAVEDLAAAHYIHRSAIDSGAGTWLEWGGPGDLR